MPKVTKAVLIQQLADTEKKLQKAEKAVEKAKKPISLGNKTIELEPTWEVKEDGQSGFLSFNKETRIFYVFYNLMSTSISFVLAHPKLPMLKKGEARPVLKTREAKQKYPFLF